MSRLPRPQTCPSFSSAFSPIGKSRFVATAGQTYSMVVDSGVATNGMSYGPFYFKLTANFAALQFTVPTASAGGGTFPANQPMTLKIAPYDTNMEVIWLEAFAGTNSLGVITNHPFEFSFSLMGPGVLDIFAVGTNSQGERLTTLPITLTFNPTNDQMANAAIIPAEQTKSTLSEGSQFATAEPGEPDIAAGVASSHSVWWRWTPAYTAETVISLNSACSRIAVYRASDISSLTRLASLETSSRNGWVWPPDPPPRQSFAAEAGQNYYF